MIANVSIGLADSKAHLAAFLAGKHNIALITDGAAYSLCGAEKFFTDFLSDYPTLSITHLIVPSANPKVETVQPLLDSLPANIEAFIAVGGGTTIDTPKLLNLAVSTKKNIKSILELGLNLQPSTFNLQPCLAFPTTAGTGAEATRFAVCYDGEVKYSIDFEVIKPTDVALIPDFTATLPPYQRASTNFDAYAQAVESLWANGATDESRAFAQKALDLISSASSDLDLLLASYYAGCAIDISRTTAAHAFSYYLTSHYGIPHGAAVYMVFEYICKNNGHPEYIRKVDRLQTLREFADEKGLAWDALIDDLFAHVNLKRLGNNPCPVLKESFKN